MHIECMVMHDVQNESLVFFYQLGLLSTLPSGENEVSQTPHWILTDIPDCLATLRSTRRFYYSCQGIALQARSDVPSRTFQVCGWGVDCGWMPRNLPRYSSGGTGYNLGAYTGSLGSSEESSYRVA